MDFHRIPSGFPEIPTSFVVEGVPKGDIQSSLKLVAGPSRIREDLAHSVPGEAQKTLSERSATSLIRLR